MNGSDVETAFHEAGHAVAALAVGFEVVEVAIVSRPESDAAGEIRLGHCRWSEPGGTRSWTKRAIVALASGFAEVLAPGDDRQRDLLPENDLREACLALRRTTPPKRYRGLPSHVARVHWIVEILAPQAARIVHEHAEAVYRIATALLKRRELDGAEVASLFGGSDSGHGIVPATPPGRVLGQRRRSVPANRRRKDRT